MDGCKAQSAYAGEGVCIPSSTAFSKRGKTNTYGNEQLVYVDVVESMQVTDNNLVDFFPFFFSSGASGLGYHTSMAHTRVSLTILIPVYLFFLLLQSHWIDGCFPILRIWLWLCLTITRMSFA